MDDTASILGLVAGIILVYFLYKMSSSDTKPKVDPKARADKIEHVQQQLASLKKKRSQNLKKSVEQNINEDPVAATRALRNMMKK